MPVLAPGAKDGILSYAMPNITRMASVHRDIKPENVLASAHDNLATDFGVAKPLSAATGRWPTDT